MKEQRRTYILMAILVVCAIILAFTFGNRKERKPAPSLGGYYTGPMRNKSNPSIYSTEAGRVVQPPPGASTSSSWEPVQLPKDQQPRSGALKD
jgi:hypothetical protein